MNSGLMNGLLVLELTAAGQFLNYTGFPFNSHPNEGSETKCGANVGKLISNPAFLFVSTLLYLLIAELFARTEIVTE